MNENPADATPEVEDWRGNLTNYVADGCANALSVLVPAADECLRIWIPDRIPRSGRREDGRDLGLLRRERARDPRGLGLLALEQPQIALQDRRPSPRD